MSTVEMMRTVVMLRDGGCVAPMVDDDCGPCYNRWGESLRHKWDLEMDYVEVGAFGPRHLLAADHVALCAGHHRGMGPQAGRVWRYESGHRELLRAYLDGQQSKGG